VVQVVPVGGDKASRILDAAEALLIAFGYRKVTIDDVVGRAGVGKGTVYLYWPSKRELFAAVLIRDTAQRLAEQLAALTADPAEVRLHRTIRRSFLQTMRRPLAKALATADRTVLGEVLTMNTTGSRFALGKIETTARYLTLLHQHGLLADDPQADPALFYRLSAAVLGSFALDRNIPGAEGMPGADLDLEDKADALVTTLRRAFEPPAEPPPATLRAAAHELADLYRQWLAELIASPPETTPSQAPA
jgi:AcrR family transcriptional regulator